ncbi:uncharacterized protein PG998_007450 [Apiospora kogelbergensis]|uniref:Uncharacterized protein n=1 Tax=Apiospora kogelbergensis TaxID=1337665 RepID=A0AAW0QT61_9PEZI
MIRNSIHNKPGKNERDNDHDTPQHKDTAEAQSEKMSQRGGTLGQVPVVTKLTGPRYGSPSPRAEGGETPVIVEKIKPQPCLSHSSVTTEKCQTRSTRDGESAGQEDWELVENPGHAADNENDNSRVAQGPGWSVKVDVGFGKGDRRLSLLSWERRVGSLVQKQPPES